MNRGAFRNIAKDKCDIVHLPPTASIVHWGCVEATVIFARIDMSKVNFGYVPIGLRNEVDSEKRGRQGFIRRSTKVGCCGVAIVMVSRFLDRQSSTDYVPWLRD